MKRYKLRTWVKVLIAIIVIINVTLIYEHRIEEINKGNIRIISKSEMSERR